MEMGASAVINFRTRSLLVGLHEELDDAEAAVEDAESAVEDAESAVETAENNLKAARTRLSKAQCALVETEKNLRVDDDDAGAAMIVLASVDARDLLNEYRLATAAFLVIARSPWSASDYALRRTFVGRLTVARRIWEIGYKRSIFEAETMRVVADSDEVFAFAELVERSSGPI